MLQITEPIDRFLIALETGKIKGEADLILEDIETHRREVFHEENMVTSAIGKIMKSNYAGLMAMNSLLPVRTLLGGVFLFNQRLTESADNIFPLCKGYNRLVGHAGQTSHSSGSSTRGNPNGAASWVHPEDGQVRFAWDFAPEQANDGPINSLALTHPGAGDCGLYPDGTLPLIRNIGRPISGVNVVATRTLGGFSWTRQRASQFPITIDSDCYGRSIWISGTTFEEMTVRHPLGLAELIEGPAMYGEDNFTIVSSRTATLSRTFATNYIQVAQDESNYYVMERAENSLTTLYVDVISKTDMSVTSKTITISGATLARPAMRMSCMNNGIVSDGSIYWISGSNAMTFVRINIETPADIEVLETKMNSDIVLTMQPIIQADRLICGRNFLVNDDTVYPITQFSRMSSASYDGYASAANYNGSPVFYENESLNNDETGGTIGSGGLLFLPYLATVNNTSDPIDKTANKMLRVQYTLSITE